MVGPISYIGGKNRLAKRIIEFMPQHQTYVEPFAGGAQVFFHKPRSNVEILNDLDHSVATFYKVLQWHHRELIRFLKFWPSSRELHALMQSSQPDLLTDIQRAARWFYLQKCSYGGLVLKQHFHYGVIQRPNYNPERIPKLLEAAHRRLRNVQIECLPYQEVLERYNRTSTLYFLDPPYWNRKLYRFNFTENDFRELESRLHAVRGKFLLTLDDRPEVRALFANWRIEPLKLTYTAQRLPGKRYGELLICNYDAPPAGRNAAKENAGMASSVRM